LVLLLVLVAVTMLVVMITMMTMKSVDAAKGQHRHTATPPHRQCYARTAPGWFHYSRLFHHTVK
jgi:flagellar basal body-associated protein FliL